MRTTVVGAEVDTQADGRALVRWQLEGTPVPVDVATGLLRATEATTDRSRPAIPVFMITAVYVAKNHHSIYDLAASQRARRASADTLQAALSTDSSADGGHGLDVQRAPQKEAEERGQEI